MRKLITGKTPDQLKMPYALWTRAAVGELIEHRFGVRLPVRTMGLYLARWDFTPRKPMRKACEQSPAAVKKWLDEEYPAIAACAKLEGAEIHWGDETGLRSDDVRGRSYAPQGQTPLVRVNNKHLRSVQRKPERIDKPVNGMSVHARCTNGLQGPRTP